MEKWIKNTSYILGGLGIVVIFSGLDYSLPEQKAAGIIAITFLLFTTTIACIEWYQERKSSRNNSNI